MKNIDKCKMNMLKAQNDIQKFVQIEVNLNPDSSTDRLLIEDNKADVNVFNDFNLKIHRTYAEIFIKIPQTEAEVVTKIS